MNDNANTQPVLSVVKKWDNVYPFKKPVPQKWNPIAAIEKPRAEWSKETEKEVSASEDKLKRRLDDLVDLHVEHLFDGLEAVRIEVDEDDMNAVNDFFFISEAIRSAVYRYHGLEHEIQSIVDEDFVIDPDAMAAAEEDDRLAPLTKEQQDELTRMTSENPDIPD